MATLLVADYARSPGGRYMRDGPYSGEWFRERVLADALRAAISKGEILEVELDRTSGYGTSFLEEAFGGLIRNNIVTQEEARNFLRIVARRALYAPYKRLAEKFLSDAKPELAVA